ncbi:alternative ribosome rescue aminoacyl-tRNA hydrolase ArfB [Tepidicaulis sp.]|uniref:alternative ribosome rescue aminoacyl-tRNA hydrolase ArfB n=1 Tax=Tepidicaulis sp. TaxID=1920809 RepID=UPI003B58E11C
MIPVTPHISLPEEEISLSFIRASGPGGQNVNKVASAVQLRFDARASRALPYEVKSRLSSIAGSRMTKEGVIVITANRFRTQEANREDAIERLKELIARAAIKPKPRIPTRISRNQKKKRLEEKTKRAQIKRARSGKIRFDD